MTDNLAIWNTVSKTDPAHTKKVNQRGGFTAISAHYQIMAATKQFGPIGIGWGYDNSPPVLLGDVVTVGVTIWHGTRENRFGPVWGGADLKDSKGKLDSDAPKKASTDGLTKGLSQLGFNADVFLGRFDDNKYVEQMRREFAENDTPSNDNDRVNDTQLKSLQNLASDVGADLQRFCTYFKVGSLLDVPASRYDEAVAALEAKRAKVPA